MNTIKGLPPYLDSFIQTISGQTKFSKFDKLWEDYIEEETRIAARKRIHGPQFEENKTFITHANKGKGKGRNFHNHKHQSRILGSSLDWREKKKDLSHTML